MKELLKKLEEKIITQMNKDIVIPSIDIAGLVGNPNLLSNSYEYLERTKWEIFKNPNEIK